MGRIPLEPWKRQSLSALLRDRRSELRLSAYRLVDLATEVLYEESEKPGYTPEERETMLSTAISREHIYVLERSPRYPLSTPERRARMLAISIALGIPKETINRLAGGI